MLTQELRDLEMNQLITRTVKEAGPIMVIYELSDYGRSTIVITQHLMEWGMNHRKRIKGQL